MYLQSKLKSLKQMNLFLTIFLFIFSFYLFLMPLFPSIINYFNKLSFTHIQKAFAAERINSSNEQKFDTSFDHLIIPKINVDDKIVYVKNVKQMGKAVWDRTSNIGNKKNRVIIGHSIIEKEGKGLLPIPKPGVFYNLEDLKIGDSIFVIEKGVVMKYIVSEKKLVPEKMISVEHDNDTTEDILTLYSCRDKFGKKTGNTHRIVIVAKKV